MSPTEELTPESGRRHRYALALSFVSLAALAAAVRSFHARFETVLSPEREGLSSVLLLILLGVLVAFGAWALLLRTLAEMKLKALRYPPVVVSLLLLVPSPVFLLFLVLVVSMELVKVFSPL